MTKPIEFRGNSLQKLKEFPKPVKQDAGAQLYRVQNGKSPTDWKPMEIVGKGTKEIRVRDVNGAYRVLYVAKFAEKVYVLHCFQKKSEKTSELDIQLGQKRYSDLLKELRNAK